MPAVRYADALSAAGFAPHEQRVWACVGEATGSYGWKLHLSTVQRDAPRLLDAVVPALRRHAVPFKVAADSQVLGLLNEGALGATQVGKFATVYPDTPGACRALADELVAVTDGLGLTGPRVVTDLHVGGVVYARYGSHNPPMIRDRLGMFVGLDGEEIGHYTVPFVAPEGIENPFDGPGGPQARPGGSRLLGPGYLVVTALQVHAKGSVLLALDLRSRADVGLVVLKEGRPHCYSDDHGRDIRDRLRNQQRIQRRIAGRVPVPSAGDLFEHAGNTYLPLGFVEGRDLGAVAARPYATVPDDERDQLDRDLTAVAASVRALHDTGHVHRDLSMRNVRIGPDGVAHLLDLEIAHRLGDPAPPYTQGTVGFVSPQQLAEEPPTVADDVYGLGAILLCALTGCDPQRALYADPPDRVRQVRALSGASSDLCAVVAACVAAEPGARPAAGDVHDALRSRSC